MSNIKKVKFSLKMKIISLLITLLFISIGTYVSFAIDIFYKDKISYIYETSLNRAESLSEFIVSKVYNSSKDTLALALISNTNIDKLQNLINTDPNILMFVTSKKQGSTIRESNRVINETLWEEIENDVGMSRNKLLSMDINTMFNNLSVDDDTGIRILPSNLDLEIPTISMIVSNPTTNEQYFCILSINNIIDQFKKDKVYRNELLDNKGKSYFTKSSQKDLVSIIKGNIPKGTKEVTFEGNVKRLVSFVKVPLLNMNIFTSIDKENAFQATRNLMRKSLYFGVLLLGISIFLGILFSASITDPINTLVLGTQYVAKGNFDNIIKVKTNDELGILSSSFNFMSKQISVLLKNQQLIIAQLEKAKEELEDYSKNLEKMVAQRTEELKKANDFLDTMINSLDQGLMVFNKDNTCHEVYTKACEKMFETPPAGHKIQEVLGLKDNEESENFSLWSKNIFLEKIPFEHLVPLGPKEVIVGTDYNSEDFKHIGLQFFPMRNEEQGIENIVTVATDKTNEVKAQEAFKEQEANVKMILKLVNNKKQFLSFIEEFNSLLKDMDKFSQDEGSGFVTNGVLICLHSIKGGAGLFSIKPIQDMAHSFESEVIEMNDKSTEERTKFSNRIKGMVQELSEELKLFLVESKNFLGDIISHENQTIEVSKKTIDIFNNVLKEKNDQDVVNLYHEYFIKEPIINHFSAYSSLVEELSESLGKSVFPVAFEGGDLRVEYSKHKDLFNVLVHVFRNSVDHGIESPEERISQGKPEECRISVLFSEDNQYLNIEITDDGRGIDPNLIRGKLEELGLANDEDDSKIIYRIFDSEFSTSKEISEVSGRGIGMSAIKDVLDKAKGKVLIKSVLGKGTTFKFSVPS